MTVVMQDFSVYLEHLTDSGEHTHYGRDVVQAANLDMAIQEVKFRWNHWAKRPGFRFEVVPCGKPPERLRSFLLQPLKNGK